MRAPTCKQGEWRAAMPRETTLSREAVIAKALEMAERDGIAEVGYNGLARELGIRPQSMYRYVANLRELRAGMLKTCLVELAEKLTCMVEGLDPIDALRAFAVGLYDTCHENPLYYQAFSLMHQFDLVSDLEEPLTAITDLPWAQFCRLYEDPATAARRQQLFMAINLGYAQMSMTPFFPAPLHDNRDAFVAAIDEVLGAL